MCNVITFKLTSLNSTLSSMESLSKGEWATIAYTASRPAIKCQIKMIPQFHSINQLRVSQIILLFQAKNPQKSPSIEWLY